MNNLLLLVGKSGTGKNYLINKLGLDPVISYTTRERRWKETEGVEHYFVDQDFYNSSIRSQVKRGDILIASTGKASLGKCDLLENDQNLVVDGHVSIIRVDEKKYDRFFFAYFFRSILGYFQMERDFTGATNQIELYADEISNFQVPNISSKVQRKIVDEIRNELDKQKKMNQTIETARNKIDEIIKKIWK